MNQQEEAPRGGCIGTGISLFARLCGIITLISIINVAFDLELGLRVYGSRTELPTHWEAVIALGVVTLITWGIAVLVTSQKVGRVFKTYPWLKWATPILITVGLVGGFYALYYNIEYGGPLHYATRANDIDAVKEELADGIEEEDYRYSIGECVKLDRVEILALLAEHPFNEKYLKEDFSYAMDIGSMELLLIFIDAGVGYEGEEGDYLAQFLAISELSNEEKETVGFKLLVAGANPNGLYTGGYRGTDLTALEQAREQGLTNLVAAMEMN